MVEYSPCDHQAAHGNCDPFSEPLLLSDLPNRDPFRYPSLVSIGGIRGRNHVRLGIPCFFDRLNPLEDWLLRLSERLRPVGMFRAGRGLGLIHDTPIFGLLITCVRLIADECAREISAGVVCFVHFRP